MVADNKVAKRLFKEWETWSCRYGWGREDGVGQGAGLGRGALNDSREEGF